MKLSMISKGLLIALPMIVLAGCASDDKSDSDSAASETNHRTVQATDDANGVIVIKQEAEAQELTAEVQELTPEVQELTPEEQLAKDYGDVILETTIHFEFDQSAIPAEFTATLDAHAKMLIDNPEKKMVVEGHADEKGTPEYNIALGERRADAVVTYLENSGVSSDQLSTVSYGEEKPVNMNHNAAAQAENRRAELTY
ncbi:MAG TPA: peptidoglycan-associated lipoprotein Pal [Psychromonas hadalis]|nr:peptidoglycan-associated lipoprotein Pal [Psychromonas hadalis]